jgi:TonB family protein
MWSDEKTEDEKRGWVGWLGRIAIGAVLIGGLGTAIYVLFVDLSKTEHRAIRTVTRVTLPPPPPPPPPPHKPPEPDKVVEQPKMQEPKTVENKPAKTPPKPQQPPASPLTAEAGAGSNPYGLAVGDGSGDVIGGGGGSQGYLYYSRLVSADVQAALRQDDKLRYTKFVAELRIWLDATGKVTRVQLAASSGDPVIDAAVTRSLSGLSMHEAPPKDMPQPIRLRTRAAAG